MTIRGLAAKILGASVRRASPSMQEWGKAMLAEMEHVEGDWAALFWALGGARSLLWAWNSPMKSLADVPGKLQRFEKTIWKRTVFGSLLMFGMSIWIGSLIFTLPNLLARVGAYLLMVAIIYGAWQLYSKRLRRVSTAEGSDALVEGFRGELARQRDFHQGFYFWSRLFAMFPGYFLLCSGIAAAYPGAGGEMHRDEVYFLILAVAAVFVQRRDARKYQRQIDELDVLRKELP